MPSPVFSAFPVSSQEVLPTRPVHTYSFVARDPEQDLRRVAVVDLAPKNASRRQQGG